nr:hypothetical protein [Shinella sumterensis]
MKAETQTPTGYAFHRIAKNMFSLKNLLIAVGDRCPSSISGRVFPSTVDVAAYRKGARLYLHDGNAGSGDNNEIKLAAREFEVAENKQWQFAVIRKHAQSSKKFFF